MKLLPIMLLTVLAARARCQQANEVLRLADSLVGQTWEYKRMKGPANELSDSVTFTRYYASPDDRHRNDIPGNVIKYELGTCAPATRRNGNVDYYIYYSVAQQKVIRINDPYTELITPELASRFRHADSVVKQSAEFRKAEKEAADNGDMIGIGFTDPDLAAPAQIDTLEYGITTFPQGMPCAGGGYSYKILFSLKQDRVIRMEKVKE